MRRLRVLHAIHDFLPGHAAGSEIYAHDLAAAQAARHDVWVLTAEYDPAANHGALRWRRQGVLTVIEVVNNWEVRQFDETYASPRINEQLDHVLRAVRPDVLHVHNLLNLSLDLPRVAHARGIPVLATLHDYTLVCIAGGQRVHRSEQHVCHTIDPARCARCFGESPFGAQYTAGRVAGRLRSAPVLRVAAALHRQLPQLAGLTASSVSSSICADDVRRRLAYVRHVFDTVDLFVAPSASMADEYVRLGVPADRLEVSANGHAGTVSDPLPSGPVSVSIPHSRLRVGYVGSVVWHKGIHVLIDALRGLDGVELIVYGDESVDPSYSRTLRESAAGLPVTFAGAFGRSALAGVYAGFDVLVVPSVWPENAPLVVQEAALYRLPVIASRIGGLPEFVRDGVNGRLVEPGSPSALRAALASLGADPDARARLGAGHPAVKSIVRDACDWERRYAAVIERRAAPEAEHVS